MLQKCPRGKFRKSASIPVLVRARRKLSESFSFQRCLWADKKGKHIHDKFVYSLLADWKKVVTNQLVMTSSWSWRACWVTSWRVTSWIVMRHDSCRLTSWRTALTSLFMASSDWILLIKILLSCVVFLHLDIRLRFWTYFTFGYCLFSFLDTLILWIYKNFTFGYNLHLDMNIQM